MDGEPDYIFDVVSRRLPEAGIDCMMIGGHAVNHYGVTRATQDIDFMIAASDEPILRRIMAEAGFSNVSVHETVIFFQRPNSSLRVDFLKVDQSTMNELLANSASVKYFDRHAVNVPQLKDLVAMKLFSLKSGDPRREEKDFPDIVNLAIEHGLDVEVDLRPLCEKFGTEDIYRRICSRIQELNHG